MLGTPFCANAGEDRPKTAMAASIEAEAFKLRRFLQR
jgi:hypothetical protein